MIVPTHRFNKTTKRIEAIAPEADESQDTEQNDGNAALDAFIAANSPKILAFLRDLLVAYESQEDEKPAKPVEESNPDESRVRQAGAAQLGASDSEEEPESAEESEPEEIEEPKSAWGKPRAFRNGSPIGVGG